jgi:hypothetical protein
VKLQDLNLAGTQITDAGLAHLTGMTGLRRLVLDGDAIKGPGLSHLQQLPLLTDLRLGCPALMEVFLTELTAFKQLERLSLANSSVSDDDSGYLAQLIHLKELDLGDTKVTALQIAHLRTRLPHCRIITATTSRQPAKP